MEKFESLNSFSRRHIGPSDGDAAEMLQKAGLSSMDDLIENCVPEGIRLKENLSIPDAISEDAALSELREIASQNKIFKSYIGLGYYPAHMPSVIRRNVLENPGWYTQYTPYQAEISQGRLEALFNFQTMISDLTGFPLTNCSLLDEASAAGEAMVMFFHMRKKEKKDSLKFFASDRLYPQTLDLLKTRSAPLGIELVIDSLNNFDFSNEYFGLMVQYPDLDGEIHDYSGIFGECSRLSISTVASCDLMSLLLIESPMVLGANAAVGTTQRFGLPMSFGGPHAGYLAATDECKRYIPGRIVGLSKDRLGEDAYRLALQTREQHIKRQRATSNICTAQALLAILSSMYAVYHGPEGLKEIAERIHLYTEILDRGFETLGLLQLNGNYFDTLRVKLSSIEELQRVRTLALKKCLNFRYLKGNVIAMSLSEATELSDLEEILEIFQEALGLDSIEIDIDLLMEKTGLLWPEELIRKTDFLSAKVFNSYHSETEMMRYIKRLEMKDLSLAHSMISLGSCTMKLNPSTGMIPMTWRNFTELHPFAPEDQCRGYIELIEGLGDYLLDITGFDGITFQPNSGAQGEFTGLMIIRAYLKSRGEEDRNIVLIPESAHGTNPASAAMAGYTVLVVKCDQKGDIDIEDLEEKAEANKSKLAAMMVTYPSTHGIFESEIKKIVRIVHNCGGQLYMDGANMNAQVGLTSPKEIGADLCHLNLHKTFGIPHGGGGPGVGPVAVSAHLTDFLPNHRLRSTGGPEGINAVAASPYGSAGVLMIPYAYIRMLGASGLKRATEFAILNANYIKARLEPYYRVYYTGQSGFVGHELIFDMNPFKASAGIEVDDIAKRLMDYGFHAPTTSFPVHGTIMVEPTESESKEELDRFCDAMISIKAEIQGIEDGTYDQQDNPLKMAPHKAVEIASDDWNHAYSRQTAAYPLEYLKANKFWPSSARIDNAFGDRNLICTRRETED